MTAEEQAVRRGQRMRDAAIKAGYNAAEAIGIAMVVGSPLPQLELAEGHTDRHVAIAYRDEQAKRVLVIGTMN